MPQCQYGEEFYDCSYADKYIRPIYEAINASDLAVWVQGSPYVVPWAGTTHLLSIALLGGAVLMVDMRVLGGGLTSQAPSQINRVVNKMAIWGVIIAIFSGVALGLGEVMRLYNSPPYWMKMASLFAGIVFTFGVRNRAIAQQGNLGGVGWALAAGSLGFWIWSFAVLSNLMAQVALALLGLVLLVFSWLGRGAKSDEEAASLTVKMISAMSIVMWLTTAVAGRWIAFY